MRFQDHLGRPVVAVTGIGVVTSLGRGKADNWKALTAGRSGIHAITRFPVDHLNTRISGMVDFLPSSGEGASALTYELAYLAAEEAVAEAGLSRSDFGGPLFLAAPPVELDWTAWGGQLDPRAPGTSMDLVKDLVDGLNHEEFLVEGYEPTYTDQWVRSVHCYHNLVIIEKGDNREGTNRDAVAHELYGASEIPTEA